MDIQRTSKLSKRVFRILEEVFPYYQIKKEFYVKFRGKRLFFDFFIKELNVAIEVHGKQHLVFTEFFHGDRDGFIRQRKRDNLKRECAEELGFKLVEIFYTDDISVDSVVAKIREALSAND